MGWFGQGHNRQGTLCPRDATSKNFLVGDTSVGDRLTFHPVQGRDTLVGMISPWDKWYKGRNIQEFSFGDTSVGDISSLHQTIPLLTTSSMQKPACILYKPRLLYTVIMQSNKKGKTPNMWYLHISPLWLLNVMEQVNRQFLVYVKSLWDCHRVNWLKCHTYTHRPQLFSHPLPSSFHQMKHTQMMLEVDYIAIVLLSSTPNRASIQSWARVYRNKYTARVTNEGKLQRSV